MSKFTSIPSRSLLHQFFSFIIFVFLYKVISDFYLVIPTGGEILGKFSPKWTAVFMIWLLFVISIGTIMILTTFRGSWPAWIAGLLTKVRNKRFSILLLVILSLTLPPFVLLWARFGDYFSSPAIRVFFLVFSGLLTATLISCRGDHLPDIYELAFGFLAAASVFYACSQLVGITNFPFSLFWSEGNRLYDYSLIFGSSRYIYPAKIPLRDDIGRQLLWGLPYLIPQTEIWLHRFWNAFLTIIPSLWFGWILSGWSGLPTIKRAALALWIFLFIAQGPIYTPLVVSAILTIVGVSRGKWLQSVFAAAFAGYYASLSRFTWLAAVPIWAGFILLQSPLFDNITLFNDGKLDVSGLKHTLKRIAPVILVISASLIGGIIANPTLVQPSTLAEGTSFSQPLLWYRLLPNSTYALGILGGLLLACGPLAALLIWLAASKKWALHWMQTIFYLASCLVLLAGGLVASVKIGGGNNLHNLDMFIVSLAILAILALLAKPFKYPWPVFAKVLLAATIMIPCWSVYQTGSRLILPSADKQIGALALLQEKVDKASQQGDILFMDQRQLLTFGLIRNVKLVREYEKKFVMDQAMAGDQEYFENFYRDLREKRFSLIITDPLFTKIKESDYDFSEENNAWVTWVARPLLCYYSPVRNIRDNVFEDFNIQLLVPRQNPKNCDLNVLVP